MAQKKKIHLPFKYASSQLWIQTVPISIRAFITLHTTAHRSVLEDHSSRGQDMGFRESFQEEESLKLTGKNA